MYSLPFVGGGDIPNDIWDKWVALLELFHVTVSVACNERKIPKGAVPVLQKCNVWSLLDAKSLHVAFSNVNAGGIPNKTYEDAREKGEFTGDQIAETAMNNVGLVNPTVITFPAMLISDTEENRKNFCDNLGRDYVKKVMEHLTRPRTTPGFEHLQENLDLFMNDHPDFDKNVFVMMRFRTAGHFLVIFESVKDALADYGLKAHRADDKIYPQDDDLWDNVCIYMMGCRLGVCIFEEIDDREFNPNVPLEYGFLRANARRVLLLKEQRMPLMPTDITGKIYKPFDMMNIRESITGVFKTLRKPGGRPLR